MISHETKRILGTTGLLFILALLAARVLPFPGSSIATITRPPSTPHRFPPALIFADNVRLFLGAQSFNLSLAGGHHYVWRFNVTYGSMMINLADPDNRTVVWSVGPQSSGSMYLNGTGVASFNWTAPVSGYYLLTFQNVGSSQWSLSSSVPLFSVCDARVWDFDPVVVVFGSSGLALRG